MKHLLVGHEDLPKNFLKEKIFQLIQRELLNLCIDHLQKNG